MGECWREGDARQRGIKWRKKKWDNCNSIINKIYLKKYQNKSMKCILLLVWQKLRKVIQFRLPRVKALSYTVIRNIIGSLSLEVDSGVPT